MTDRELLELAAKAAGIYEECEVQWCDEGLWCYGMGKGELWSPINDDGDALRLAVTLSIAITPYPIYSHPKHSVIAKQYRKGGLLREANPTEVVELHREDAGAATRRAIVRAAAEIGKAMP